MSTSRNFLKTMVLAMAGMVLVYLGVGQVLATAWQVETTRSLGAKPEDVAALVGDLRTWSEWASTDANLGPETVRAVEGTPATPGHRIVWSGQMGKAMLTLTAITPNSVDYSFGLQAPGGPDEAGRGSGRVEWRVDAGRCEVRWIDRGTWNNLPERWYGWFGALQEKVRQFQTTSLTGLQARLDTLAAARK
jgi:hypothetical protein